MTTEAELLNEYTSFKQADASVDFVKHNAKKYGALVGACKGLEHKRKVIRAMETIKSNKKTVADRNADAESSLAYMAVIEEIENTWADKTELETLLKAAEMTFDLYRSSNKWGGP